LITKLKVEKLTSPWVFDHVIEWNQETFWDGRSWMDQLTPFDHTVCLDADMLFMYKITVIGLIIMLIILSCICANRVFTYRSQTVTDRTYRRCFDKNHLPDVYSMWTFFSKDSQLARDFFDLGRHIIKNPVEFSNTYLHQHKPKVVGTDEAFALAAKILDILMNSIPTRVS
jgi:hypothetical protein